MIDRELFAGAVEPGSIVPGCHFSDVSWPFPRPGSSSVFEPVKVTPEKAATSAGTSRACREQVERRAHRGVKKADASPRRT
jgi:hypothetical protein